MECIFSDPQELATSSWAYSKITCQPDQLELIQNASTGAEFYVSKTIDYGETLIIIFITIFTIFLICKIIFDFLWHK